jgi:hypothetical protein
LLCFVGYKVRNSYRKNISGATFFFFYFSKRNMKRKLSVHTSLSTQSAWAQPHNPPLLPDFSQPQASSPPKRLLQLTAVDTSKEATADEAQQVWSWDLGTTVVGDGGLTTLIISMDLFFLITAF